MDAEQFISLMPLIVCDLVDLIAQKQNLSEAYAVSKLSIHSFTLCLNKKIRKSGNTVQICFTPCFYRNSRRVPSYSLMCKEVRVYE